MSKIRIVQVLCPLRHCIIGVYYESRDGEPNTTYLAGLQRLVDEAISKNQINPWCGICFAGCVKWKYEDAATIFKTMDEAHGPMAMMEVEQHKAAKLLKPQSN
jgi:hypothetical protein